MTVIKHSKRQLGICIDYKDIREFMLWLHWGKFVNVKCVKISCSAALPAVKYIKSVK